MSKKAIYLLILLFTAGCASEATTIDPEIDTENTIDTDETQTAWLDAWMLNTTGETSAIFNGVEVNVTDVYTKTEDGVDYQCIVSSGIPNYETVVDEATLDTLTNRPNADTDFANGVPDIIVGNIIGFGEAIGYDPAMGCTDSDQGYGYWPPGPACPTDQEKDWCFPMEPEPIAEGEVCETGLNQIGVYVNGVSIFNWQDGQSYDNAGVWVNDAFHFEIYDLDICVGHSANGNYHHHSSPTCLGDQLEDSGDAASPIYGFAADGYPIYGPWEAEGVLAQSCWMTRDYENVDSPTGCGIEGGRTCLLVDQYDISQGTIAAEFGPSTSDIIISMSGNPITAVSGAYFQDYYYDSSCTAQGDEYLDEHNGHYSEELGYHYHTTLRENEAGELEYAFPHYAGPTYAGVLTDNAIAQCSTRDAGGPGGGQAGGPPGDAPDFAAAAESLGVSEAELMAALGDPPPDIAAAAAALGVTEAALGTAP